MGRVRKWGRGGRELALGGRAVRQRGKRETVDRAEAAGVPLASAESMAEEEGDGPGSSAPDVSRGLGKEGRGARGLEAWTRGTVRSGRVIKNRAAAGERGRGSWWRNSGVE